MARPTRRGETPQDGEVFPACKTPVTINLNFIVIADDLTCKFGHGSRTCIGKNISLMEISTLIPELVRRFDFEIAEQTDVDDGDGDGGDALRTENVWFVKLRGFRCRVTVRVR